MTEHKKIKRRGFVMTGGGAKGLYEAGVIHAFHITGMEFDVITGSSIGAMNSIFYAEYQLHKRALAPEILQNPEEAIQAMDPLVKAFHHAWWELPEKRVIDDSEEGPLGKLKEDLLAFDVNLPQLTRLAWWWTDPQRGVMPPPMVWPAVVKLAMQLSNRLGGSGELLRIFKDHRSALLDEAMRTYLARFGMEKSLVPPADDHRIKDVFTSRITPLTPAMLQEGYRSPTEANGNNYQLVNPERTFREYSEANFEVRLTRANYRTGRLEVSTYFPAPNFVAFLEKQAWRVESDPEGLPLGSFRLQIPGNPNAINSALASGRFPGVFTPYPITSIYPLEHPDNQLLDKLLDNWLESPESEKMLYEAYCTLHQGDAESLQNWTRSFTHWRDSKKLRDFFPRLTDLYIDGGAIDNTPSNSAVDATREWADQTGVSRRDLVLDLYVVLLSPEPKITSDDVQEPAFYQVVNRTLAIQGAAKMSTDAKTVDTINGFGQRGSDLGESLLILLDSYKELFATLDDDQKKVVQSQLKARLDAEGVSGYKFADGEGVLDKLENWGNKMVDKGMPLQVSAVKIYPDKMSLDTLQFTQRLGYKKDRAIEMITLGCYNTLWSLRRFLEQPGNPSDEQDQKTLTLARKWMGVDNWPKDTSELDELRSTWKCQRVACAFHEQHCRHGARIAEFLSEAS